MEYAELHALEMIVVLLVAAILYYIRFHTRTGEIWALKRRARRLYLEMDQMQDESDCGHKLLCEIYPHYKQLQDDFDAVMHRLRQIDPKAPKESP
jgi:hypothetical protein